MGVFHDFPRKKQNKLDKKNFYETKFDQILELTTINNNSFSSIVK